MESKGIVGEEPFTLSDADIASRRTISRRMLLNSLGVTAGIAAAVMLRTAAHAQADQTKSKRGEKARIRGRTSDADPSDRAGDLPKASKPISGDGHSVPGGLPGAKPEPDPGGLPGNRP